MDYLPGSGWRGHPIAAGGGLWYWRTIREERRTFLLKPLTARGKIKKATRMSEFTATSVGNRPAKGIYSAVPVEPGCEENDALADPLIQFFLSSQVELINV